MNGSPKRRRSARSQGFTVAELITVVAIVAILASVAMPIANFGIRRQKEIELHDRIRKITDAIDKFHELAALPPGTPAGMKEPVSIDQGPWPKDLESLTKPIALNSGQSLRLLRERDLIDPMTGRAEWIALSADDDADSQSTNGKNVYEIHSKSTALALDGKTHYNEW
ncbi:MAG: ral secretion pathway protein [Thermoanaerobaculia bacterium]|jgi:general secretion pathway protein G|nr:ral secretion pathway protein [Thermoanaerobaculia bacterium]